MDYLTIANQKLDEIRGKARYLDGHQVIRVIWETPKAVVFADEEGLFWRYTHAHGKAWPVIVGKGK